MRSRQILAVLKAQAYKEETTGLGDALGDLVHWLAAREDLLADKDEALLMSVCLALYKNQLEKDWDEDTTSGRQQDLDFGTVTFEASSDDAALAGRILPSNSRDLMRDLAAERAIETLVALRRPPEPDLTDKDTALVVDSEASFHAAVNVAANAGSRRRRWTDNSCWSLTLRT